MQINRKAVAGTLESSDVFIQVEPSNEGIKIDLESVVINQFGEEIERVVRDVLQEFQVENIKIQVKDRGAVECAIRARVETALRRAEGMDD
ncbi:MAG: citrate lyase acyl carrier protein [Clostridiales bacterium]|jgi:citrate lyase subunit gamma (acyl carrier protein)|nr:citrate lyase acyl carrier protein [Clostridiales bacterium]